MKLIRIATYCFLGLAAVFPALFLAAFLRNVIEYPGHFEATPLAETLFANSPWVLALILAARLPKAPSDGQDDARWFFDRLGSFAGHVSVTAPQFRPLRCGRRARNTGIGCHPAVCGGYDNGRRCIQACPQTCQEMSHAGCHGCPVSRAALKGRANLVEP